MAERSAYDMLFDRVIKEAREGAYNEILAILRDQKEIPTAAVADGRGLVLRTDVIRRIQNRRDET